MSLRFKLNLVLVTLLVSTNSLIAYLLIEKQQDLLSQNITQQADAISTLISQDAIELIVLNSPDSASDITTKLKSLKTLVKINFYNIDHQEILTINNQSNESDREFIQKTVPLFYKDSQLGSIDLFFSNAAFEEANSALGFFLLQVIIIGLLITGLFALFLDIFFSRRICELNTALETTADNQDYSVRLPVDYSDELGKAFLNFNNLVTNTEKLTNKLKYQATHDNLTGLYNRLYVSGQLTHLLASPSAQKIHALCYFDLDKFKIINDSYGHPVGDRLLIELSAKIRNYTSDIEGSYLARIGGDEFVLIVKDTDEESLSNQLEDLRALVNNFSIPHQEQALSVGISIGAILFQAPQRDMNMLFSAADTACYHAKHKGGNTVSIFWLNSPELESEKEIINWVQRIRYAISQRHLQVYLQPIINSHGSNHHRPSYESLIRLVDGDTVIAPGAFIPTLERFKMIPEMDFYMISKVVKHLKDNADFLNSVEHISINLSGLTINMPHAAEEIINILENSKVPFTKICFEITETTAVSNLKEAKLFIDQLSDKGCLFSLDDFGTGMASFEYLYELPLNFLKIDGSFIKEIAEDPVKFEMVKAMQNIALLMDLETVAEYVENQDIIDRLNEIGVQHHQGFHYSEPKPIELVMESYINHAA